MYSIFLIVAKSSIHGILDIFFRVFRVSPDGRGKLWQKTLASAGRLKFKKKIATEARPPDQVIQAENSQSTFLPWFSVLSSVAFILRIRQGKGS
jgi:hypothetical protein